jgi:hypothetical protein
MMVFEVTPIGHWKLPATVFGSFILLLDAGIPELEYGHSFARVAA